jgi:hypothetical protein
MGYYQPYIYGNTLYCDQSDETCTVADMQHRTVCFDLRVLDCGGTPDNPCGLAVVNGGLYLCAPTDSWNCNLCPNDLPYFNPVDQYDVLKFQFQQIDNANGNTPGGPWSYGWGYLTDPNVFAAGKIIDCCTGNPIEKSPGVDLEVMDILGGVDFVGIYGTTNYQGITEWNNIQQIYLKMDLLLPYLQAAGTDCFYLEFYFDVNLTPYTLYTEGFRFEKCVDTLLVEGFYNVKDCYNQYYSDNVEGIGNWGNFYYQYRVKGFVEMQSISLNKEFVGNNQRTVSSQVTENYLFKTFGLPLQVVKFLANMLSAPVVKINGVEYIVDGDIAKNNDVGNQWFLEVPLKRINCSQTFGCN